MTTIDEDIVGFGEIMSREMEANSHKGEKSKWIEVNPKELLADALYHAAKLAAAIKDGDDDKVEEYAGDIANMAMMTMLAYNHQKSMEQLNTSTAHLDMSM